MQEARLSIGLIGPGRAGAPVAAALARAGHLVNRVSAISDFSIARANRFFPAAQITDPIELIQKSDLVIVAVPDDQLTPLISGLAQYVEKPGQFWAHLSGAHGLLPFLPVIDRGAIPLALHPAMTFTGDVSDVDRLFECPFGVTAPANFQVVAEALVLEMGGVPNWISDADRPIYHAALTHASNHLNTLISESIDLLKQIGVEQPGRFLQPLTTNSLEHALVNANQSLTGPIRRGDVETVVAHLAALSDSHVRDSYVALAKSTLERMKSRLPSTVVQSLQEALDNASN